MAEILVERRRIIPGWVWVIVGLGGVAVFALLFGLLRHRGEDQRAVTQTPAAAECGAAQVHFDTDSAVVRAGDQDQIARMARCLKADQSMKLTIAGNADERGAPEHNADLGEKRAMAVARALSALGVSASQLKVVSYGDNYPLCGESDTACWAKNRQASLVPRQDDKGR